MPRNEAIPPPAPAVFGEKEPDVDIDESLWTRAIADWHKSIRSYRFGVTSAFFTAVVATFTFPFIDDPQHTTVARAAMSGATVLLGLMIAFGVLFACLAAQAPYKQRNESRAELRRKRRNRETKQEIAMLIAEGQGIKRNINANGRTENGEWEYQASLDEWLDKVHRFLTKQMGRNYNESFRASHVARVEMVRLGPILEPVKADAWLRVEHLLAYLYEFMEELDA